MHKICNSVYRYMISACIVLWVANQYQINSVKLMFKCKELRGIAVQRMIVVKKSGGYN